MLRVFFLLIFAGLSSYTALGQGPDIDYGIGVLGGFLMPHHPDMDYLVDGHIKSLEFELAFNTDGSKDWHHGFNFPNWGIAMNWYNLGSDYLGQAVSARLFLDLPLEPRKNIGLKMAIGPGYITNPFSESENIHNTAIGSSLNTSLSLDLYGRILIGKTIRLKPGIGIHHFSNGAFTIPNSGINMAMLKVLVSYHSPASVLPERKTDLGFEKSSTFFLGSSFGTKQILPIGGDRYPVVNFFGLWQKRISLKSSFGAELGLNYNSSLEQRLDASVETGNMVNFRLSLSGVYNLHFDPFGLRLHVGSYIAPEFTADGYVFFRYHLLYNYRRFQFLVGLKSHFAKADNGEVGIMYRLK